MPIIGGVGTVAGPLFGALIFSTLQIKLLSIPALRDSFLFIYGGLLIVVMLFEPKGLVGVFRRFRSAGVLARWPGGVSPPTGGAGAAPGPPSGPRRSQTLLPGRPLPN